MKVKFCGMTNIDDVLAAVDLGVDFVGFVFYQKSKRFVEYNVVSDILNKIDSSNVKTVGVFVEQTDYEIKKTVSFLNLDYAQVYKDIDDIKTIRVYRIKDGLPKLIRDDGLILFDSFTQSIGGSGRTFDWGAIDSFKDKNRLFVAGGISQDNVNQIKDLGVYGVDLVSSIEKYPGKKDVNRMREFMKRVGS